jgi:hypothetical protein
MPVASRYTDWATRPTVVEVYKEEIPEVFDLLLTLFFSVDFDILMVF